jgi:hypothetical protein
VQNQDSSEITAPMKGRLIIDDARNIKIGQAEICGNRQESQNGDRVTKRKQTEGVANRRETSEGRQRRADAGVRTKAPPSGIDRRHAKRRFLSGHPRLGW